MDAKFPEGMPNTLRNIGLGVPYSLVNITQGCHKQGSPVTPALTCIFSLLCRIFLASSDHQLLFLLLVLLTLFCVPVVIFSLLSTDTAIPEDFDDLRVP